MPLADHAERIAYEHGIDATTIHQGGKAGVVAGQHRDFFTTLTHALQRMPGDGFSIDYSWLLQVGGHIDSPRIMLVRAMTWRGTVH